MERKPAVTRQGQFYVTFVRGIRYQTSLLWRGLWRGPVRVESELDRRFAGPRDFRQAVLKREGA